MADDEFSINLMRLIAAQQFYLAVMQTSREMFGRSYFSLGQQEKAAVDSTMNQNVAANYQQLTAQILQSGGITAGLGSGKPN